MTFDYFIRSYGNSIITDGSYNVTPTTIGSSSSLIGDFYWFIIRGFNVDLFNTTSLSFEYSDISGNTILGNSSIINGGVNNTISTFTNNSIILNGIYNTCTRDYQVTMGKYNRTSSSDLLSFGFGNAGQRGNLLTIASTSTDTFTLYFGTTSIAECNTNTDLLT